MEKVNLVEKGRWIPVAELRAGAIFEIEEGPRYVKAAGRLDFGRAPAIADGCFAISLADGACCALSSATRVREVIGILPHRIEIFQ